MQHCCLSTGLEEAGTLEAGGQGSESQAIALVQWSLVFPLDAIGSAQHQPVPSPSPHYHTHLSFAA